jgi:hypothetical protein
MGLGDKDSAMYVVPVTLDPVTGLPTRVPNGAGSSDTVLPSVTINAQNTSPAGAAPAGSTAPVNTSGRATAAFQINTNTLNVALVLQVSNDNLNWITVGGNVFVRQSDGALVTTIPAGTVGLYTAAVADFSYVRLSTQNLATTGSATVIAASSSTVTVVTLDNINFAPASTANNPAAIVPGAAVGVLLLAANLARRTALIRNDSGQPLFVRLGTGVASATQYSLLVPTATGIELPAGYTGAVRGLSTLAGAAPGVLVTEITA